MALRRFTTGSPVTAAPPAPLVENSFCLQDLESDDPQVRRQAVWMAHPTDALAEAICLRLADETSQHVLEAMFVALSRCDSAYVVAPMFDLLASEDVLLRTRALEVLEGFPESVAALMQGQLADAEPDVRIFLVNLMGGLRHPCVPDWLDYVLHNDAHSNVVAAALEVALEVAGPQLRPAVQAAQARFHADPFIGFAADLALQRIEAQ